MSTMTAPIELAKSREAKQASPRVTPQAESRPTPRIPNVVYSVASVALLLALWAWLSHSSFVKPGYLPTPDQHRLGGYETWIGVNKVQLDASMKMVNALLEMLGELNAEKP